MRKPRGNIQSLGCREWMDSFFLCHNVVKNFMRATSEAWTTWTWLLDHIAAGG